MTFYTYAHVRLDTGLIFYIGKGVERRAWSKENRNKWWHNIANKHGYDVQILAHWNDEAEAFEHEKALIACFREMGSQLVNISDGGQGPSGYRHTDLTRKVISEKNIARMKRPEERRKISESLKGVSKGRPCKLSKEEIARRTASRYLVTRKYTYGDKSLTIKEWCELLGLPNSTVRYRFQIGASPYEKRSRRGEPGTLTYRETTPLNAVTAPENTCLNTKTMPSHA